MAYEGLATHRGEQSLAPLVSKSDSLTYKNNIIVAHDKLEVPLTEHGIPDPQELIRRVMGTIAGRHIWTGQLDVHHIAWPEMRYKSFNRQTSSLVGGQYRGAAALKVRMPRQLHNYIHAVTEPPQMPDLYTMQQWTIEQRQVDRLYDTVRRKNMEDFDITEEQREKFRYSNFLQKLETMEDGHLGLMPDRDTLGKLDINEARIALRSLARIRGISNSRTSRRQFFRVTSA